MTGIGPTASPRTAARRAEPLAARARPRAVESDGINSKVRRAAFGRTSELWRG